MNKIKYFLMETAVSDVMSLLVYGLLAQGVAKRGLMPSNLVPWGLVLTLAVIIAMDIHSFRKHFVLGGR